MKIIGDGRIKECSPSKLQPTKIIFNYLIIYLNYDSNINLISVLLKVTHFIKRYQY